MKTPALAFCLSALLLVAPGARAQEAPRPARAHVPVAAGPEKPAADDPAVLVAGKPPDQLVVLLGHARFKVRQAAEDALKGMLDGQAGKVVEVCYKAYEGNPDPEVRMRARAVLMAHVTRADGLRGRGFVGIGLMLHPFFDPAGKMSFGIKITQAMPDFPGAKAGLKAGDLITGVDDLALNDQEADQKFMDYVGKKGPGKVIDIKVSREGAAKDFKVTLARRPDNLENRQKAADPEELFQAFLQKRKEKTAP